MSLFDGVKGKLGFGNKSDWQDEAYDEAYEDDYVEGDDGQDYLDGPLDDEYVDEPAGGGVVSFDAYNPDKFENVKLSDRTPRVASYDTLGSTASSRRGPASRGSYGGSSNVRPLGPSTGRDYAPEGGAVPSGGSWNAPEDPSFLDNRQAASPARARDVVGELGASARDPYSSLGSDFMRMHGDPSSRLEIVRPKAYADVEKIANAAKAGKSVVLVVCDTKPALAKRILDFSFGVASALNVNVDKAADRVFVISKGSEMLNADERAYLKKQGVLKG